MLFVKGVLQESHTLNTVLIGKNDLDIQEQFEKASKDYQQQDETRKGDEDCQQGPHEPVPGQCSAIPVRIVMDIPIK